MKKKEEKKWLALQLESFFIYFFKKKGGRERVEHKTNKEMKEEHVPIPSIEKNGKVSDNI